MMRSNKHLKNLLAVASFLSGPRSLKSAVRRKANPGTSRLVAIAGKIAKRPSPPAPAWRSLTPADAEALALVIRAGDGERGIAEGPVAQSWDRAFKAANGSAPLLKSRSAPGAMWDAPMRRAMARNDVGGNRTFAKAKEPI